jgi:predicted Zn-dependent peptidase
MKYIRIIVLSLLFVPVTIGYGADSFSGLKSSVKAKVLSNGMRFIVLEQSEIPVISFHVYTDVGSTQESDEISGIAHLLEHLAFKGSKTVGTRDYLSESKILDEEDAVYDQLQYEKGLKVKDDKRIKELEVKFDDLEKKAKSFVVNNEYFDLLMKEGDTKVNAYTSSDATQYVNGLPSNRLEFWMAVTSDRFLNPVFRDFYKEKAVVMEERRLTLENNPQRRLLEDFFASAFKAHPYRRSVVGNMSDVEKITRSDVTNFFKQYYTPNNMTAVIVGDVKADEVFNLAQTYFGRLQQGPRITPIRTVEPEQWGERKVTVAADSEPFLILGYKRPAVTDKDDLSLSALAYILGEGRTSRLYERLVKKEKKAMSIGVDSSSPGDKYPSLLLIYAVPNKGTSCAQLQKIIEEELDKIKKDGVRSEEVSKYIAAEKKQLIDSMKNNGSMARLLAYYQVVKGDWNVLFDEISKIEKISTGDVKKAAQIYLINNNRTIGELQSEKGK